jgi:hypothetical protein
VDEARPGHRLDHGAHGLAVLERDVADQAVEPVGVGRPAELVDDLAAV